MSSAPNSTTPDEHKAGTRQVATNATQQRNGSQPGAILGAFQDGDSDGDGDLGAMDDVSPLPPEQAISATAADWKLALDAVIPAVVAIKNMKARSFDTSLSAVSQATGFVVDKARGLLLTNRHVVTPGPVRATGTFHNRELVPLLPVYYDPIHDFGFYRFNPKELKFMQVPEVPLSPEGACVGLEVRLIGNDTGEKIAILAATLARLDRDAPYYGHNGYNDFNTFYIQAASNSKGGSSGSPVIDCKGRAVGLNAGGKTRAASAFYLPLHRVVRALQLIQQANPDGDHDNWQAATIPRGDLQTSWVFKGFDDVRRLGLSSETEKRVRESSGSIGMLVVARVVPGSPADGKLEPGDVLVTLQGEVLTSFLRMEEILDDHVGQTVHLTVERGSKILELDIEVTDLHSVTPSSFLEVGRAVLNSLSYQQARNHNVATGMVYVADSGDLVARAGVPRCAIITSLDNKPTPDLRSLISALQPLPHGARVRLQYFTLSDRHITQTCVFKMDRQWHAPPQLWQRDDSKGVWHSTSILPPDNPPAPQPTDTAAAADPTAAAAGTAAAADPPAATAAAVAGTSENGTPVVAAPATAPAEASAEAPAAATAAAKAATPAAAAAAAAAGVNGDAVPGSSGGEATPMDTAGAGAAANGATELSASEIEDLARGCLVMVDAVVPHTAVLDGVQQMRGTNNGVLVYQDEHKGLVVVDHFTVPISSVEVNITFAVYPVEVPGVVHFLHPLHNFALVSYNTKDLPEEARKKLKPARLKPSPPLARGDTVRLVVLTRTGLMSRSSHVTNATVAQQFPVHANPRFRPVHEELVLLDQDFGSTTGVLMDSQGFARAVYVAYRQRVVKDNAEYTAGLPVDVFMPWIPAAIQQADPRVSVLNAELHSVPLAKAAQLGLPSEWVARMHECDRERSQVLSAFSFMPGSDAAAKLKPGDMLLEVDGQLVSSSRAVEKIIQASSSSTPSRSSGGGSSSGGKPSSATAATMTTTTTTTEHPTTTPSSNTNLPATAATTIPSPASVPAPQQSQPQPQPQPAAGEHASSPEVKGAAGTQEDAARPERMEVEDAGTGSSGSLPPAAATAANAAAAAAAAAAATAATAAGREVQLLICRAGQLQTLQVALGEESGMGTRRVVQWAGTLLQPPHRAVREVGLPPAVGNGEGVYIALCYAGSPAAKYSLFSQSFITELDGVPIPDLDTFLQVAARIQDGQFVRIKLCKVKSGKVKVLSLQTDALYWPTWQLQWDPNTSTWRRTNL